MHVDRSDDQICSWWWRCLHYLSDDHSFSSPFSLLSSVRFFFLSHTFVWAQCKKDRTTTNVDGKENEDSRKASPNINCICWSVNAMARRDKERAKRRTRTDVYRRGEGKRERDFVQIKKWRRRRRRKRLKRVHSSQSPLPLSSGHTIIIIEKKKKERKTRIFFLFRLFFQIDNLSMVSVSKVRWERFWIFFVFISKDRWHNFSFRLIVNSYIISTFLLSSTHFQNPNRCELISKQTNSPCRRA